MGQDQEQKQGTALDTSQDQQNANEETRGNRELYRFATRRPAEVEEGGEDEEEYAKWRATTDLREPYRVPRTYLSQTRYTGRAVPEAPLIVFINSRSGGHAGPRLTETLCRALGQAQVFDLQHFRPAPVLKQIWANLTEAIEAGDKQAEIVRSRFKILCAGGDGTVAWILGTIHKLDLRPIPQCAVMPLGTGNDLSLTFGWGNAFLDIWIKEHRAVYDTLARIAQAEPRMLDVWRVTFTTSEEGMFGGLPHGLEAPETDEGVPGHVRQVGGLFWNYFSIGMDAKAAYGFHSLREKRPWAASGRAVNQAWYGYFSCSSGWFCAAPALRNKARLQVHSTISWYGYFSCSSGWFCAAPALRNKARLQVRDSPEAEWRTVELSSAIKALVVLNLQSYAGGRDLWGLADTANDSRKGWRQPIFNDGLIEIVGLKSGWHAAAVMGTAQVHAKRLAQTCAMRLELLAHGGAAKHERGLAHMQLDGEPWAQAIPAGSTQPLVMEVTQAGQSCMLANPAKLKKIAPKINKLAAREFEVGRRTGDNAPPANGGVESSNGALDGSMTALA